MCLTACTHYDTMRDKGLVYQNASCNFLLVIFCHIERTLENCTVKSLINEYIVT